MTFFAYLPVLSAGFVWDDYLVSENVFLRSISGLGDVWTHLAVAPENDVRYWPLFYSSFWIDYHLFGDNPYGYHLINLLIHIANVLLVWVLVRRMKLPGAWLAAAVFALHPLQAESVCWVIERKGLLATFFCLLAFITAIRFYEGKRERCAYFLSLVFFAASLLSKPVTVTFPLVVLLWIYWRGMPFNWRNLGPTLPYFGLSAIAAYLNILSSRLYDPVHFGLSFLERFVVVGRAFWFYVAKLFWPTHLVAIYPRWTIHSSGIFLPLALLCLVAVLWVTRRKIGKGPFVAVSTSFVIAAPVLGFMDYSFMAYSFVANRYQYLSCLPLILLVVLWFARTRPRWGEFFSLADCLGVAVLLIFFGALTFQQAQSYEDTESLFRYNIENNPGAPAAYDSLGFALIQKGRYPEAESYIRQAIGIKPDLKEAHNNLGLVLVNQGKIADAIPAYEQAIKIDPKYVSAMGNLGNAHARLGQFDKAAQCYNQALAINPKNAESHYGLGLLDLQQRETSAAMAHFRDAVSANPNFSSAHNNLGVLLESEGDFDQAREEYLKAINADPKSLDPRYNLANIYIKQQSAEQAISVYRDILKIAPNAEDARRKLEELQ